MTKQKSNKELVAAGHAFAKAQDADAPLTEIAKLVSDLATRLDVMDTCNKALATENYAIKNLIELHAAGFSACSACGHEDASENDDVVFLSRSLATPETNVMLNSLRAEGIHFAVNRMLGAWESGFINDTPEQTYDITGGFLTALEFLPNASPEEFADDYHREVRSAIAQSRTSGADVAVEKKTLSSLQVDRDKHGYWTHPVYELFCDGRESIAPEEFNQWLKQQVLKCSIQYRDEEEIDPKVDGYDISSWQPEAPAGEGWFVASIHDTEDGAVCIWLRAAKDGE